MITHRTRWLLLGLLCLALLPACAPQDPGRGDVPGVTQGQSPELMDAYNRYTEVIAPRPARLGGQRRRRREG